MNFYIIQNSTTSDGIAENGEDEAYYLNRSLSKVSKEEETQLLCGKCN